VVFWCIVLGGPPIDLFESPRLRPFIYFQF
jgi:hypothetical protein